MLWLTIRRSTASWPFSLISASSRKPEITRSRASGSTTSSTPGVANSATASIKLILLVNGMVWSVRVGMAWHSPQRAVLKFGFLSDRLDAKKMSIPRSGSGSPGPRSPPDTTRVPPAPPSPVGVWRAVTPGSRLKWPSAVKQ